MGYLNIAQLINVAYGLKDLKGYKVDEINTLPDDIKVDYQGVEVIESLHEASRLTALGTPVILPLKLKGLQYQTYNDLGEIELKQFEDFELPASSLVTMRRNKIVTKTKALAAKGTVKEMYGFSDWRIDIVGVCLADSSHPTKKTAYDQKLELAEYEEIVDSVQIVSEIFNDLKIDYISIEEINFKQLKAYPGVIPFSMKCFSDEPIELKA